MTPSLLLQFLFGAVTLYGGLSDASSFRIPNAVTYGLILLFIPYAIVQYDPFAIVHLSSFSVWPHLMMFAGILIMCTVFWLLGWMGGGDVKFLSAIGLWMGFERSIPFVIGLAVLSFGYVGIMKFLHRWDVYFQAGPYPVFFKRMLQKIGESRVPYGLPAAISAVLTLAIA